MIMAPPSPPVEVYERRKEIVIPAPAPVPMEVIERVTSETHEDSHHHQGGKSEGGRRRSKSHGAKSDRGSHHRQSHSKSERRKSRSKSISRRSRSRSSDSSVERTKIVEDGESSARVRGLLSLAAPVERHKDERGIKNEIKALEREEKALKLERKAEREERKAQRLRRGSGSGDVYVEADRSDGVKLERNKKGKLSLVR